MSNLNQILNDGVTCSDGKVVLQCVKDLCESYIYEIFNCIFDNTFLGFENIISDEVREL